MKTILQVGLVVMLTGTAWAVFDRMAPVEPEEIWELRQGHPASGIPAGWWITAEQDGKFTRHELGQLQRAIALHDHEKCLDFWEHDRERCEEAQRQYTNRLP